MESDEVSRKQLLRQARGVVKEVAFSESSIRKGPFKGRGIVTCGGGYRYFTNAWILIRMLRHLGCRLPIELWYLGPAEMDGRMARLLSGLKVKLVDATPYAIRSARPGWVLKTVAIARSSFEEVLFLDADNAPVKDPSFLFELPPYRQSGTLFWPDVGNERGGSALAEVFGLADTEEEAPTESGQMVINKRRCWEALSLVEQLNLRSDVFFRLAYGAKDLFRLAWRKMGKKYALSQSAPHMLSVPDLYGDASDAVLCQDDFSGERLFQHRMFRKWDLLGANPWVSGCFMESKSHELLEELKGRWNGRSGPRPRVVKTAAQRAGEKELVRSTWLLSTPAAADRPAQTPAGPVGILEGQRPAFVIVPQDVGKINIKGRSSSKAGSGTRASGEMDELKFSANGTISKGANAQTGYFWELSGQTGKPELLLSTGNGHSLRLKPAKGSGWEGQGITLQKLQDVYPHLSPTPPLPAGVVCRKIIRSLGKKVQVMCSGHRMGDHILATYACAGLCRMGVEVVFHTPHAEWLGRVNEPGLTITKKESPSAIDVNWAYASQLRYGQSRAAWYAAGLHPLLKPVRPVVDLKEAAPRLPFEKYVVLAPYTELKDLNNNQNWPETHWTRLANLLRREGYELIALGSPSQAATLLKTFSQTQVYWAVGHKSEWIIDVLLGAKAFIGVDTDLMQLAALFQLKSVAIHSQLPGSFLWPEKVVRSVNPTTSCTFCRWQEERGYLVSCSSGCSALATISPETALTAIRNTLKM